MVAKLRYIYFIYVLIGAIQLICYECECTNSSMDSLKSILRTEIVLTTTTAASTTTTTTTDSDAANLPIEARRLSDESIESITSYSNLLSDSSELLTNEQITKPTTISAYGPSYSNHRHSPVHHIVALHMPKPLASTYSAAPSLLTTPYAATSNVVPSGNRLRIVQISNNSPSPWTSSPSSSALSSLSQQLYQHQSQPMGTSSHQLAYLENQYMDSFRNIKSSVMIMINKVQDFMSYVMSFFTMGEPSLIEGRYKKMKKLKNSKKIPKFKVKKKFKKFIIPLLLAYKLKFFALIPLIIGGLILLVGSTGMAGFFFALFTAVISLKHKG